MVLLWFCFGSDCFNMVLPWCCDEFAFALVLQWFGYDITMVLLGVVTCLLICFECC